MATKYSILEARLADKRDEMAKAMAEAEVMERELRGLDESPCGLNCDGCGTLLVTEGDFARHFIIPDSRYLNLGNCPNSGKDPLRQPWA